MADATALFRQAVQHYKEGRFAQAEELLHHTVQLDPRQGSAFLLLGFLASRGNRLEEATTHYRQAVAVRPDFPEAWFNLGNVLQRQGELDEAIASYRRALAYQPRFAAALLNLGNVFKAQGLFEEAIVQYEQALALQPGYAEVHINRGNALAEVGRFDEAEASYRRGMELRPDLAETSGSLGSLLKNQGRLEEADACLAEGLRRDPANARLRVLRATLLPPIYRSTEEVATWRERFTQQVRQLHADGVRLDLTQEPAPSVFYLAYQGQNDRDLQRDLAALYVPSPDDVLPRSPAAGRKIRLGLLSRYFRSHTIGELMGGVVAHLARDLFTVVVLSLGRYDDEVAQAFRTHADEYVELPTALPAARRALAACRLDVLLYTDIGMDPFSYSLAFSRLAPVQCTTWGHPVTTGIPAVDYYLSSTLFESAAADAHYTERLVRLRALPYYGYRPPEIAPAWARQHLGFAATEHVYACPQSLFKLHPDFDPLLGEILRRDPQGILVLVRSGRPSRRHWEDLLEARFQRACGDVAGRVHFLPRLSHDDYLALNAAVDVLLDPLHFNGGNTSLKALAVGTPIVTLPTALLRGRLTQGMYAAMGVDDCLATSPEDYVARAVRLGTDAAYRAQVRERLRASNGVLFDNPAGVRAMEQFFQEALVCHGQ